MKLEDVLSIVSESRNLYVWENGEIIAQYDGRDSIPEELNDRKIELVDCSSCKRWDSTADWKRSSKQTRDLFFWSTY